MPTVWEIIGAVALLVVALVIMALYFEWRDGRRNRPRPDEATQTGGGAAEDLVTQEIRETQRQTRELREQMAAARSARLVGTGMSTKELVQQIQLSRARIELTRMQRSLLEEHHNLEAEQRRLEGEELDGSGEPRPAAPAATPVQRRVSEPEPDAHHNGRVRRQGRWADAATNAAATQQDVRDKGYGDAFYGRPEVLPPGLNAQQQGWYRAAYQEGLVARRGQPAAPTTTNGQTQPAAPAAPQPAAAPAPQPNAAALLDQP